VVYTPPEESVRSPAMFNEVVPGLKDVEPKVKFLNQLPVVIVATEAPVVNVTFTAFVVDPPVVPNVNVRVLAMSATVNPPVPVYVKLVTMAILNTVVAAVVCVRLILAGYGFILLLVGRLPPVVVELYDELSVK
jgi:hypothetical protein